jgi:hypothetical protein
MMTDEYAGEERERVQQHPHCSSSSRPLRTHMRMLFGVLHCHRDAQKLHAGADAGCAGDGLTNEKAHTVPNFLKLFLLLYRE